MPPAAADCPLVLAKDNWGTVTEQGFTDEPTARAAAKQLNVCWVLFRHTALKKSGQPVAHTYQELAKGGMGFAHGNIRKFVFAKHPATVVPQGAQKKESDKGPAAQEPESPKKPDLPPASKSGKHVWDGGSWQPSPGQPPDKAAPAKAAAAPAKVAAKAPVAAAKAAPAAQKAAAPKARQEAAAPKAAAATSSSPFARCCACFAGK